MPSVDELAEIIEMDFGRGYSEEFKGKYSSGEAGLVDLMRFLKNKDEQFKAEQERLDNEYSVKVDSREVHDEKILGVAKVVASCLERIFPKYSWRNGILVRSLDRSEPNFYMQLGSVRRKDGNKFEFYYDGSNLAVCQHAYLFGDIKDYHLKPFKRGFEWELKNRLGAKRVDLVYPFEEYPAYTKNLKESGFYCSLSEFCKSVGAFFRRK